MLFMTIEEVEKMIECPFCGDTGFDLTGLKGHLLEFCSEFDRTETPAHEAIRKMNKGRNRRASREGEKMEKSKHTPEPSGAADDFNVSGLGKTRE
jgi:hypothetical protein